jgi:DNA adenine methylase
VAAPHSATEPTIGLASPSPIHPGRSATEPTVGLASPPPIVPTPVLRWAGGKRAIAPLLYAKLPPRITSGPSPSRYFEPFAGGAALHLHMRALGGTASAVISDVNADLIATYQAIAADPVGVFDALALFADGHSAEKFYIVRDAWNGIRDTWRPARRAAAMIYLNKNCFNGLWRVNEAGGFNVPVGYKTKHGERIAASPSLPSLAELGAFASATADVEFRACGFVEAMTSARAGDVIYADPPYLGLSPTSNFTSYASGGFGVAEHEMLAAVARELVRRGVFVMLSNADVPKTYELYPRSDWNLEIVHAPRKIAARGASRGVVTELVITPREF